MKLDEIPERVRLRKMALSDLPALLHYWYQGNDAHYRQMSVDKSKLPSRLRFIFDFYSAVLLPRPFKSYAAQMILLDGVSIGYHRLDKIIGKESGVFHAHIFVPELRKRGIGTYTYPRASALFLEWLKLKKIIFETPEENQGPNRIKEKLGLAAKSRKLCNSKIVFEDTFAKTYEMNLENLSEIFAS